MIHAYHSEGTSGAKLVAQPLRTADDAHAALWIDMVNPSPEELSLIGRLLDIALPTLDEMREIEVSSRLYEEDGALFMTMSYVTDALQEKPTPVPITFVIKGRTLITVRYREMRMFNNFTAKATTRTTQEPWTSALLLAAIIENVTDWYSDVLEKAAADLEAISHNLFHPASRGIDYKHLLTGLARTGALTSKIHESLVSLERLLAFFRPAAGGKGALAKVNSMSTDTRALIEHTNFVNAKISFMLDATLGMVSIEQNGIIKIFSVAAVIFLPPTLIASIYGMNFRHIPELALPYGYYMALILMVISAALPFIYFKAKKWL